MRVQANSKGEFYVGLLTKENIGASMCCIRAMIQTEKFRNVSIRMEEGKHYHLLWVKCSKAAAQRLCDLCRGMSYYDYPYAHAAGKPTA